MQQRKYGEVLERSSPKLLMWRTADPRHRDEVLGALEEEARELQHRSPDSAALFEAAVAILDLAAMDDGFGLSRSTLEELSRSARMRRRE